MGGDEKRAASRLAVCAAALLFACTGQIERSDGARSGAVPGSPNAASGARAAGASKPGAVNGGSGGSGASSNAGSNAAPNGVTPETADELPAPTTRAARLTHSQWQRSVVDLLRLDGKDVTISALRADPKQAGFVFDDNALTMVVDQALASGYESAAATIAQLVAGDAARLAKVAPAAGGDPATRQADFIRELGLRAHRRPLSTAEQDEYAALFAMGPSLYTGLDAFAAGARIVIEAMLQSPYFLYRIEESAETDGDRIPLDSYELASRLSYALWGTMPDDALFDAAGADSLLDSATLSAQARRLIGDDRAKAIVEDFHTQLFDTERFASISPSPAFFPNPPQQLGDTAATELTMFVDDVVLGRKGSYADLLTSTDTFVNADLAKIYGLSGSYGASFVKASLDPSERRGILTQVGFLAAHSTSVNPDPIHRGVFIARRIECATIAAPPANIPALPTPPAGQTNRKTIEDLTQDPNTICSTCHAAIINPLGFPFESYDAIGGFRTQDAKQPVDTHSEPVLDGASVPVAGALELIDALAKSDSVHGCYAQHWLEYMYGRPLADQDDPLITRLAEQSLSKDTPVEDMIVGLVTSPAFLSRSVEELP